jgi:dihydropyrimidinase
VIRGGTVWDEHGGGPADVLVEGGRIAAVGQTAGEVGDAVVVDASGLDVLPGFVDVHVHVADRIGRFELADDFASGSEIAVTNGITTFFTFATQRPGETMTGAVRRVLERAEGMLHCDAGLHLTPTRWPWDWAEIERLVAAGFRTFKLYTTYRDAGLYSDWVRIEEVMRRLAPLGARLLLHAEDDETLAAIDPSGVDVRDPHAHTQLRPERVEVAAIRRAIELAEKTGCPLHVVHVSTADGAGLVAAARGRAPVTMETGPHYLLLSDEVLRDPGGHRHLCTPPLRAEATRTRHEALAAAGAFDLLATDHCAFRSADKDDWDGTDFRAVPNGLPGLGALVPLAFELLVRRHGRPLSELVRVLAANPARLLGLYPRKGAIVPGADADLVVLDPRGPSRPVRSTLADAHDPWSARTTTQAVRHVLLRGTPVVIDGALRPGVGPLGRPLAIT